MSMVSARAAGLALFVTGLGTSVGNDAVKAETTDAALFTISKSENKNEVQYVIRIDEHCAPGPGAPISAFWRMLERSPTATEPLLEREQRAYGLASQSVSERTAAGGKALLTLMAVPTRPVAVDTFEIRTARARRARRRRSAARARIYSTCTSSSNGPSASRIYFFRGGPWMARASSQRKSNSDRPSQGRHRLAPSRKSCGVGGLRRVREVPEETAELQPRAMRTLADRLRLDAEDLRRLLGGQPLEIAQDQRRALRSVERIEGVPHQLRDPLLLEQMLGADGTSLRPRRGAARRATASGDAQRHAFASRASFTTMR